MNTRVPSADWVTVEDLERDPHPTLARLRTVGPVVWVPALSGWMITTREDNLAAMRDDVGLTVDDPRFTTGQITGPSMLSTDGAEHARHRTPFARPFRLDAIRERFTHETALEGDRLIDAFASDVELRTQLEALQGKARGVCAEEGGGVGCRRALCAQRGAARRLQHPAAAPHPAPAFLFLSASI